MRVSIWDINTFTDFQKKCFCRSKLIDNFRWCYQIQRNKVQISLQITYRTIVKLMCKYVYLVKDYYWCASNYSACVYLHLHVKFYAILTQISHKKINICRVSKAIVSKCISKILTISCYVFIPEYIFRIMCDCSKSSYFRFVEAFYLHLNRVKHISE